MRRAAAATPTARLPVARRPMYAVATTVTAFAASDSTSPTANATVLVEDAGDSERKERDRPEQRPADDSGAARLLVEHERARGERDCKAADRDRDPTVPEPPDGRRSHSEHQQGGRARRAERDRDQLTRLGIEPVRVANERGVVVRRQARQIVPRRSQHEQWERDADDDERRQRRRPETTAHSCAPASQAPRAAYDRAVAAASHAVRGRSLCAK